MIMLAQTFAEVTGLDPTALGAFGVFLTIIGKLLSDARKDKRDLLLEQQKQNYLQRIAESNEQSVVAQTQVKAALEATDRLNKERHDTLLLAIKDMSSSCKQINQSKQIPPI